MIVRRTLAALVAVGGLAACTQDDAPRDTVPPAQDVPTTVTPSRTSPSTTSPAPDASDELIDSIDGPVSVDTDALGYDG